MIEHIHIRDFQSLKDVTLPLGKVTVLMGRGDTGKSATIRALTYALLNKTGGGFIRHGASTAKVSIDLDGHHLEWNKPAGSGAHYTLDGKLFTKMAGALPTAIAEVTGVKELEIDSMVRVVPQIQRQFDPPFILSYSPSQIARILGRLSKLNIITAAQLECRKREQRANSTATHLSEQLVAMEEQVALANRVRGLEEEIMSIVEQFHKLTQFAELQDRAFTARSQLEAAELECREAEDRYHAALRDADVCEACPWK